MEFETYPHRLCDAVFRHADFAPEWSEITGVLTGISDEDIIEHQTAKYPGYPGLSYTINDLIHDRLVALDWSAESCIFTEAAYCRSNETRWRLDFAKKALSVEVAFNHGEAVAWNLIKPVLASELNHVDKAIQTRAGVVIAATDSLKRAGGLDGSVGTYEKFVSYLRPLNDLLTVPIMVVGLLPPRTFCMTREKVGSKETGFKHIGRITLLT